MKKKEPFFKIIFILLFILFSILYFGNNIGYFNYEEYRKTKLTEEEIKRFEEDIKNGKEIDKSAYFEKEKLDYSTSFSKMGYHISNKIETFVTKSMNQIFKFLNDLNE